MQTGPSRPAAEGRATSWCASARQRTMSRPGVADGLAFQKQNASRPYRRAIRGSRTRGRPSTPTRGALPDDVRDRHRRPDRPGLGRRVAQRRARQHRARPAREPDGSGADDDVHGAVAGPHAGARVRRRRPALLRGRRAAHDHDEQGDHDDRAPSDDDLWRGATRHRPGRARRGGRRRARRRPGHGRVRRDLDRRGGRGRDGAAGGGARRDPRRRAGRGRRSEARGGRAAGGRARRAAPIRSTAASSSRPSLRPRIAVLAAERSAR